MTGNKEESIGKWLKRRTMQYQMERDRERFLDFKKQRQQEAAEKRNTSKH